MRLPLTERLLEPSIGPILRVTRSIRRRPSSTDGFVYCFDLTGEPAGIPQSAITVPANNAVLANPNGSITVRGTFSGTGAKRIEAAIQNTLSGKWWNRAQNSWGNYIANNIAISGSPWS